MDTPEKTNFLSSVRELRAEAEDKLKENRYYLAIQKLDEITEAVESRGMSPEEMEVISGVLQGQDQAISAIADDTSGATAQTAAAAAASAAAAGAGVAVASTMSASTSVEETLSEAETVVVVDETVATKEVASADESVEALETVSVETSAPSVTSDQTILPNWWKTDRTVQTTTEIPASVEDVAVEAEPVITTPEPEVAVESADITIDTTTGAAAAAAAVAAGVVTTDLVTETVETVEAPEEIQLIDVPEVEIDTPSVEVPEIDIEVPEVKIPEVELPEAENIELVEVPQISEVVETVQETANIELAPDVDIELEAAPDIDLQSLGLEVPKGDALSAPVLETIPEAPAVEVDTVSEVVIPEIVAPAASVEIPDVVVPESDSGAAKAAAVAAGAAAVVAASVVVKEEVIPPKAPEPEPASEPVPEVVVEADAPEKLSFPSTPVIEEVVEPAATATKVWSGKDLQHHPSYGGNRGGFVKRFINSLRGKDYI